jgi:signal transduction histidine kinase/DNA-binding response OmpR family regulator
LPLIFFSLSFAGTCLQADLIVHYDFSDGNLLDNEVSASDYRLEAMRSTERSMSRVGLNTLDGTAMFDGGTQLNAWLETEGPGALQDFTVSFWFRTDQVNQGHRYSSLFASNRNPVWSQPTSSAGKLDWGLYSNRDETGALEIQVFNSMALLSEHVFEPNVWQHVLIRKRGRGESAHTELYLHSLGDAFSQPLAVLDAYDLGLEKIILGVNRSGAHGYRMEMANVKIFDDLTVGAAELFAEGPGTSALGFVPVWSIHSAVDRLDAELANLQPELEGLPQIHNSLQLDSYGFHSSYLPVLEAVPEEPRWVVELELKMTSGFSESYMVPAADRRVPGMAGYGFPKRFRMISVGPEGERHVLVDWRERDYPNPGRYPVGIPGSDIPLSRLILEVYQGQVESGQEFFALDEIFVRNHYRFERVEQVHSAGSYNTLPFWSADYLVDQKTSLGLPLLPDAGASNDLVMRFADQENVTVQVELDLLENREIDSIVLHPAHSPESIFVPGFGFPGAVEVDFWGQTDAGAERAILGYHRVELANPSSNVLRLPWSQKEVRWLRFKFTDLPQHEGRATFALGEIEVAGGRNYNVWESRIQVDVPEVALVIDPERLVDGEASGATVLPMTVWLDGLIRHRDLDQRLDAALELKEELQDRWDVFVRRVLVIGGLVVIGLLFVVVVVVLVLRQMGVQKMRLRVEQERNLTELEQMKIRFFTHISHELRTPLTLILGLVEKLLHSPSEDNARKLMPMAQRNVKKLQALVDQLLDFRKLQDGRVEMSWSTIDVAEFVHNGFEVYHSMASDKRIRYTLRCPPGVHRAAIDGGKLQKIMDNLIGNALKYSPERAQVTVTLALNGTQLTFVVEDTGAGIAPDDLSHVFEQYFRADSLTAIEATGSGIGLAFVKDLVELWGGEISVESPAAEGKGTRFTVCLPFGEAQPLVDDTEVVAEDAAEAAETEAQAAASSSNEQPTIADGQPQTKPVILLVEDNPDVRAFIRLELVESYTIHEAENGQLGLDAAREYSPDLVLSDVMMPVLDGMAMCRQLKADAAICHIPVILLTARSSEGNQLEGLERGADDYISKPFHMPILQARIRNMLESRRLLRERFGREPASVEPSEVTLTSIDEVFLKRAIEAMEDNMREEEFNVESLAAALYMSRSALYLKLKALVDQTPQAFMRTMRLKRGAQLLRDGAGSISEIAAEVGFLEPTHFSRGFKRQFGMTPSQYRETVLVDCA